MSGKKKHIKKKTKESISDAKSVASETSIASAKTAKTIKSVKSAKSVKSKKSSKKSAKSVVSDQNLGIPLADMKKGKSGTKPKFSLSCLRITDKRLPPPEIPKPLKINEFPDIEYKEHSLKNKSDIGEAIEKASSNSKLVIPEGIYKTNIVIKKSVSIVANGGVVFISPNDAPAITVEGKGIHIKGIAIVQKRSMTNPALYCKDGSVKLEECVLMSENTPALILSGNSTAEVVSSSITAVDSPSVVAAESSSCHLESCDISKSNKVGVIAADNTSVKITTCNISNNREIGVLCRDCSKLYIDRTAISKCRTGVEICSSSDMTAVVSSSVVDCSFSGISIYGLATSSISDTVVAKCNGPAVYCSGGCGVLLKGNEFSKSKKYALLYLSDGASLDSINDTLSKADVPGALLYDNSEIVITNGTYSKLPHAIIVNDNATLTVSSGKFNKIKKVCIASQGTSTVSIYKATISKVEDRGIVLQGTKSFTLEETTIKECGNCAIDATSTSDFTITNCTIKDNKKIGVIATDTAATINGSTATGNGNAFIFVGNKGTMSDMTINDNENGVICSGKGSVSIEKSNINNNSNYGAAGLSKSSITLRSSALKGNGVLVSEKSSSKLRKSGIFDTKAGIVISGHKSSTDIDDGKIEGCKAAIISTGDGKIVSANTNYTNNKLCVEVAKGGSFKSDNDQFKGGSGYASVTIFKNATAEITKAKIEKPGLCAIYAENAAKVTINDSKIKDSTVSGLILQKCTEADINTNTIKKIGRSGVIVSGEGTVNITKNNFSHYDEAAVLTGKGAQPKLSGNKVDGKETAELN